MTDKDIKNHFKSVEDFLTHRLEVEPDQKKVRDVLLDICYFLDVKYNYAETGGLPTYGR